MPKLLILERFICSILNESWHYTLLAERLSPFYQSYVNTEKKWSILNQVRPRSGNGEQIHFQGSHFWYGHNKLIIRFSFIFFSKWGWGVKFYFLFFIFPDYTEIGDGWLKIILISANHLYLVNKECFFIIPMYYEKTNGVCNNQNSLERAIIELKKPLFSVSLRTLLDKKNVINLFCSVWFFLSCHF